MLYVCIDDIYVYIHMCVCYMYVFTKSLVSQMFWFFNLPFSSYPLLCLKMETAHLLRAGLFCFGKKALDGPC